MPSIKPKAKTRVTMVEVEDSDNEREIMPLRKKFNCELPFKDVGELADPPIQEVLP